MQSLNEMVKKLPPERQAEVIDFIEFLLVKESRKPRPKMNCDWAGGLEDLRGEYSSVELQHKAGEWRTENEISR
jgi:hypothetical protein